MINKGLLGGIKIKFMLSPKKYPSWGVQIVGSGAI